MKKWEDIVKDKMDEPEGALPESVFAEFRARRDAAAVVSAPKRFPLVWAVVPAVALERSYPSSESIRQASLFFISFESIEGR